MSRVLGEWRNIAADNASNSPALWTRSGSERFISTRHGFVIDHLLSEPEERLGPYESLEEAMRVCDMLDALDGCEFEVTN